jgi:hypothetical protein
MSAVTDLLAHLSRRGVTLTAAGDHLRVEAPTGAVTPAMRATLAERKGEIMAHLTGNAQPEPPPSEIVRIPLTLDCPPSAWAAARGLRIVGGTPHYGGVFRPMLYLAETAQEVAA